MLALKPLTLDEFLDWDSGDDERYELMEIVLLDQQQLYCEVHRRLDGGRWQTDLLRSPDARLTLDSIGFDQPLSALYANVSFEEE